MKEESARYIPAEETAGAENEKNVRLTVVGLGQERDDDELVIDFGLIIGYFKRLLALWLCVSVGLGALSGAAALTAFRLFRSAEVKALISFSQDVGTEENIRKIKSPVVVEAALNELGLPTDDLENIRNSIEINGVIPDKEYEQMSMYYDIISKNANKDAVQSLLDTSYRVSKYVVSFDYAKAKLKSEEGVDFMNALLHSYQDYFAKNYNYNTAIGSPLGAINYADYDYAEAVNIFSTTLDKITSYLSAVESSSTAPFRSAETGFTFQDLRRAAATLRSVDLDRISSYIVIHSVSSFDAETEISYYQWRIEELTRQRAVQRAKLASLTRSIEEYEKDPVLIAMQDGNSVVASETGLNDNYDAMIRQKLDTQSDIASFTRSISYYESVIEGFRNAEQSAQEDVEKVREYLASLNAKVNALIANTSKTVDEYYDRAAFANRVQVLIPATTGTSEGILRQAVLTVAAVEALVFFAFGGTAFVRGIRESNRDAQNEKKKRRDSARS